MIITAEHSLGKLRILTKVKVSPMYSGRSERHLNVISLRSKNPRRNKRHLRLRTLKETL
jgi:hypothetical protein